MTATIVTAAIKRRKIGQRNATHVTTNSEAAAQQQNVSLMASWFPPVLGGSLNFLSGSGFLKIHD
jgi:hypothetical protein